LLRAGSVLPPDTTTVPATSRAQQSSMKHLRLGRLNGDELAAQLMELAGLVRYGACVGMHDLFVICVGRIPILLSAYSFPTTH
jgi:hypothetical protein